MKITTIISALVAILLIYMYNTSKMEIDSFISSFFGLIILWMLIAQIVENKLEK